MKLPDGLIRREVFLMTIQDVMQITGAKLLTPAADVTREVTCGYAGDLLSLVMSAGQPGMAWITVQTHMNVIAVASNLEMPVVIISEGITMEATSAAKAEEEGVAVLSSDKTSYELAGLLFASGLPGYPAEG